MLAYMLVVLVVVVVGAGAFICGMIYKEKALRKVGK